MKHFESHKTQSKLFCLWGVCAFYFDGRLPFRIIAIICSNTDQEPNAESLAGEEGTPRRA